MNTSNVLYRSVDIEFPMIVSGHGLRVQTADGRDFLDAVSGGAAVSCLGHSNSEVEAAIVDQLQRIPFYHNSFFTSEPAERLASQLLQDAPAGLERVVFCTGGSEAIDTALKLARQYWVERGEPDRSLIVSRRQSYHGATFGGMSVGGNDSRKAIYTPMLFPAEFIPPCYTYREAMDGESEEAYGRRAAQELELTLQRMGPERVAAFIMEPVVGATLGSVPAAPGYLRNIRDICDRHGILLILDEIMCGLGRTGDRYACLHDGVSPDMITIAKGLGGGFQPIGGVVVNKKIVDVLQHGSRTLKHGFTYMAHPVACAAALAVQEIVLRDDLISAVRTRSTQLRQALDAAFAEHPFVGNIRGRGLFQSLELVADRTTKRPFSSELMVNARFKKAAMDSGILTYPGGGCVDGTRGDHVLLAPAFTVTSSEIDEIVERLADTLESLDPWLTAVAGQE